MIQVFTFLILAYGLFLVKQRIDDANFEMEADRAAQGDLSFSPFPTAESEFLTGDPDFAFTANLFPGFETDGPTFVSAPAPSIFPFDFGDVRNAVLPQNLSKYDTQIFAAANGSGVDPILLKAIVRVESNFNPSARSGADAWGLTQVLCTGTNDNLNGICQNKFFLPGWDTMTPRQLLDPDTNLRFGADILKWNIGQFGTRKAVAVYNRWASRLENEPFTNQTYLNDVTRHYAAFGGGSLVG